MPASWNSTWSHPFLNAMLRAVNCASSQTSTAAVNSGGTTLRSKATSPSDWGTASNGEASITGSLAMTHNNTGTVTSANMYAQATLLSSSLYIGTASPSEVETSNLGVGTVITGAGTPAASNVTRWKIGLPKSKSTVSINLALRNKLVDLITNKVTAHFSAAGTIKVYSGSAPDVDSAETGTLLWQKTTTTTTWNAAAADACVLAASLTGNSEAFGSNLVAGYARFIWNVSGTDYIIQGSVCEASGDFQFTDLVGAGNNEMAQSSSYTLSNATISFVP